MDSATDAAADIQAPDDVRKHLNHAQAAASHIERRTTTTRSF